MPSWTPRPPISFQAGLAQQPQPQELPIVKLQVVQHPDEQGPALVSRATAEALGFRGTKAFLELAEGSDCIMTVAVADDGSVGDGQLAATAVQRHNLHLGAGVADEFRIFVPPAGEPFELVEFEAEISLLDKGEGEEGPVQVDARALTRELLRLHFGSIACVGEACVLAVGGHRLLLRATACDTLDAEAREAAVAYHCFRGLLTHETQIYLTSGGGPAAGEQQAAAPAGAEEAAAGAEAGSAAAAAARATGDGQRADDAGSSSGSEGEEEGLLPQSLAAARGCVALLNARKRPPPGPSRSCVNVYTSDGEWFPVKRKLLRPCIALTGAVRSEVEAAPEVHVDVDTLTFDRVLIFLEALALGREPPAFGLHLCPQLLAAARHLGLRDLEEYAQGRLGESVARLRHYGFDEIRQLNAAGGCWLILDGMVLDVTRWLPEHPGGAKIIPKQSLNIDCSRQFELYHASRESFVYLRQFYQGEVLPEDLPLVPAPKAPPSPEFLEQLREFTPWRLAAPQAATHLGAKPRRRLRELVLLPELNGTLELGWHLLDAWTAGGERDFTALQHSLRCWVQRRRGMLRTLKVSFPDNDHPQLQQLVSCLVATLSDSLETLSLLFSCDTPWSDTFIPLSGRLRDLVINECHLLEAPPALSVLSALTGLSIAPCEPFADHFLADQGSLPGLGEVLGSMRGLEFLALHNVVYNTTVPAALSALTRLTRLNLSENFLGHEGTLPDCCSTLTALQRLDLASCGLPAVPAVVTTLSNLRTLVLSHNGLSAEGFPPELPSLSHLEALSLRANPINQLPPAVQDLSALTTLDICSTAVSSLPGGAYLSRLEELKLPGYRMLPAGALGSLASAARLRKLWLAGLWFQELPQAVARLPQLAFLDLSHGRLSSLPAGPWCANLRALCANYLQVDSLAALPAMPQLSYLSWLGGGKVTLPAARALLERAPALRVLHLQAQDAANITPPAKQALKAAGVALSGSWEEL